MPVPGLMFVGSHILDPKVTSDEQYNRFYNDEHLPDVLACGLQGSEGFALRYLNVNPDATTPYLALYPLEDANVMQTDAVAKLVADTRTARTFGNRDIYDFVHFDLRPFEKIHTFEVPAHAHRSGTERGRTLMCVAVEPAEGGDAELDEWYRKQHFDMLSMCPDYRRSTRYRRIDGKTPRYLTLSEWDCEPADLPREQLAIIGGTEWAREVVDRAQTVERDVFVLIQAQGKTELKL